MPRTKRVKSTHMVEKRPGDETGIYYIPVSNLAFGTTWQNLNDWVKDICRVKSEIFKESTSGWLEIRGKENFENVWNRVNGGILNGRAVIATDQNRAEPIMIRVYDEPEGSKKR